jgi:Secretion system C-terminal sorting domain
MKRSILAITIAVIYMPLFSNAQLFEIIKDKAIGTIGRETYPSLISINDHELIMACRTDCDIDGDKTDPICDDITQPIRSDIWLVKLDTALNIIWNKSIGGGYTETEPKLTYDSISGHIFISCTSISDSSCDKSSNSFGNISDFWVVELDTAGNILNDHRYGGLNQEERPTLIILPNRQRMICGYTKSSIGGDKTSANHSAQSDFWVIKTDSTGQMIWDRSYGGTGFELVSTGIELNETNPIFPEEGTLNFFIAGSTNSPQNGDISQPPLVTGPNLWLAKFDSSGNKIWDKRLSGTMESHFALCRSYNNGFLTSTTGLSGYEMSDTNNMPNKPNLWVAKMDSLGNKIWDQFWGGSGNPVNGIGSGERYPSCIELTYNNSYLISCTTNNDAGFEISESTYGLYDYWLLNFDENGNKIWDKRFGGSNNEACGGFIQMPDSSIFIYGTSWAGGINSIKTDSGHFYTDIWIVHFKYQDTTTVTSVNSNFEFEQGIKLFPNPATNFCTVQSSKERINSVLVYNTVGELIDEIRSPSATSIQIPLASYAPGLYFATIKSEHHIVTKKLVIKN